MDQLPLSCLPTFPMISPFLLFSHLPVLHGSLMLGSGCQQSSINLMMHASTLDSTTVTFSPSILFGRNKKSGKDLNIFRHVFSGLVACTWFNLQIEVSKTGPKLVVVIVAFSLCLYGSVCLYALSLSL